MSMTAYEVQAHGHDRNGDDYGYVNIMYRYGGKMPCPRPDQCEKMEVMWADESVYGPPAPGCKVGDFIMNWLMGSCNCGVFTHREIAQRLAETFTGLKIKELEWFENPREKTLKSGKPRNGGPSGCRSGRWIWCTSTPTTILTQEIRLPLKPTSSRSRGWTPGAKAPGLCVLRRPPRN